MGLEANWRQVFGRNPNMWLFPMMGKSGKPEGSGVAWPLRNGGNTVTDDRLPPSVSAEPDLPCRTKCGFLMAGRATPGLATRCFLPSLNSVFSLQQLSVAEEMERIRTQTANRPHETGKADLGITGEQNVVEVHHREKEKAVLKKSPKDTAQRESRRNVKGPSFA